VDGSGRGPLLLTRLQKYSMSWGSNGDMKCFYYAPVCQKN
jgi:hypothetical protein